MLECVKRESGKFGGLHSTSLAHPVCQPMLFDLDDAKKHFLHFYPAFTVIIEAPFALNVKIILDDAIATAALRH